jgi:hypothetical protein
MLAVMMLPSKWTIALRRTLVMIGGDAGESTIVGVRTWTTRNSIMAIVVIPR